MKDKTYKIEYYSDNYIRKQGFTISENRLETMLEELRNNKHISGIRYYVLKTITNK